MPAAKPGAVIPINENDARILHRSSEILSDASKWNRNDDRNCPTEAATFSLYCVLYKASVEINGEFDHRLGALEELRRTVEEVSKGKIYEHRLMGYNNDPATEFNDVKNVLQKTEQRIIAAQALPLAKPVQTFDRNAWLADFKQLERIISNVYPNLESKIEVNGLNLYETDREIRAHLKKAQSDAEATDILKEFVANFKDGHFLLKAEDTASQSSSELGSGPPLTKTTPGTVACAQTMGAKSKNIPFQFPTPKEMGFSEVKIHASSFAHATLQIGKNKIGFARIAAFGQGNYPELCAQEWETYRDTVDGNCDKKCQEKFVYERLPNRLLAEFEQALAHLAREEITALILDITSNGGGTDWVGAVMRMLTTKPVLCGQFGFIRHPHWAKNFREQKEELFTKLKAATDPELKQKLQTKLTQVEVDLKEVTKKCDRSKIWTTKGYKPSCSLVVKRPVLDCSPNEDFQYKSGIYQAPLFVLVNNGTASVSEDLVGRFKDSGIATIIGERTKGSGCGFTNGGIKLKLKNSGIRVVMSDCARFLRDGTNEVQGIAPDIELPMAEIKSEQFPARLKDLISKAVARP